ncbi:MAG TPA: hypothetical protein PKH33_17325 [bacterium]|nr:hypothetical protein [bacterium]
MIFAPGVESANCFEVMGLLRRMRLLTSADLKKAMRLMRGEWVDFMLEKIGLATETNNESG